MRYLSVPGIAAVLLLLAAPAGAQSPATPADTSAPAVAPVWETPCSPPESWPLFTVMLDHRGDLDLSPAQVEGLERLCLDVMRDAIRREAELGLASLDLATVLRPDPADPARLVDMPRVEAAVRQIEGVEASLDLARIRAIEAGKAQLTAEQRITLAALVTGGDPAAAAALAPPRAPGHPGGHPGGQAGPHGGPRPPQGHGGGPGAHPGPHPGTHPDHHPGGFRHHPFVAARPFWGGSFWYGWRPYAYAVPPVIVEPSPSYIEPPAPVYWYYCPSAGAYYPYVQTCDEPWVLVPSTAP